MGMKQYLLISHPLNEEWARLLSRVLAPYGKLEVIERKHLQTGIATTTYDFIIIDAGIKEIGEGLTALQSLISQLREKDPKARIIIATSSPTWRHAKDVLQSGATDYIRQSMDEKKQQAEIETTELIHRLDNG